MQAINLTGAGNLLQHPPPVTTQMVTPPAPGPIAAQIEAAWLRARRYQPLAYSANEARAAYLHQLGSFQREASHRAADMQPVDLAAAKRMQDQGTETLAFLTALAALGWDDLPAVADVFTQNGRPVSDAARPIFTRHPALQRWDDRRMAAGAAIDAANAARAAQLAADRDADAAEHDRQAPARLLATLRGRGIVLGMDGKGASVTAAPAASLGADDLDAIRHHKPALLALLRAEADAAKPVVVA